MYTLRAARNEDSTAVRDLVRSVLSEYGLTFDADNTDADLTDVQTNYHARGGVFLILESPDKQTVGCGGLYPVGPDAVELRKMYLLPEARGKGLGKKLLTQLLAEARRLGYKRVILETNSVLIEAISLYRSFGFRPVPRDHLASRCDQAWEFFLTASAG